mmetsp:Transcript_24751/g.55746  ORF Transcript_24751/g.55746 Transcript_24751/m.55746 type:complete len:200 (-) Transcript_24751:119-718(-)
MSGSPQSRLAKVARGGLSGGKRREADAAEKGHARGSAAHKKPGSGGSGGPRADDAELESAAAALATVARPRSGASTGASMKVVWFEATTTPPLGPPAALAWPRRSDKSSKPSSTVTCRPRSGRRKRRAHVASIAREVSKTPTRRCQGGDGSRTQEVTSARGPPCRSRAQRPTAVPVATKRPPPAKRATCRAAMAASIWT